MTDAAERVARAVLYEGYLLYPYYASSPKNRHRFQFGGLYPRSYTAANPGADRSAVATEVLVQGDAEGRIRAGFRGLHLLGEDGTGDEAEERRIDVPETTLGALAALGLEERRAFGEGRVRAEFRVKVTAAEVSPGLFRVRAEAANETDAEERNREKVLGRSLLSAHFAFSLDGARFLSQIDPPPEWTAEAARNRNEGLFPVLVGEEGSHDRMLASPIILYDFPRIAPESRGDLFDGLEIDEILSLRIRTLTDAEKEAVRATGPRAAALLERTERLTAEELLGLHGARRDPRQETGLRAGDRVRLRPRAKERADIFDVALAGKTARVESVEQTLEDACLIAVSIDDDPGRDLGRLGIPGHRFFFHPDEVERL
jgi:hypothetical protein